MNVYIPTTRIIGRLFGSRYDASNPFSRSFIILSLGLLADDRNQSCTLALLTVCVTLGLGFDLQLTPGTWARNHAPGMHG